MRKSLRRLGVLASVLLFVAAALVWRVKQGAAATLPTLKTITIDGDFSDWDQILINPLQVTVDDSTSPDLDNPGGNGRDITRFAWTYDAVAPSTGDCAGGCIYTYVERFDSTASTMTYFFIMDLDQDGLAEATDRVLVVTWSGGASTLASVKLHPYVPPNGQTAVPMVSGATGLVDGYNMPGSVPNGAALWNGPTNLNALTSTDGGQRFEIFIPWAQLGLSAGSPVFWHVACNANDRFDNAVDNVGGPDRKLGTFGTFGMTLTPERVGATGSPGVVNYCHTVSNVGQFPDVYSLKAVSSTGSTVRFYTANGSCGPATLMATDANGDGDFSDPGDSVVSAFDSIVSSPYSLPQDGLPDTGNVAAATSLNFVVQVQFAAGFQNSTDSLRVTATSQRRPLTVSDDVVDTTRIGDLTIIPNYAVSGTPGSQVLIGPHTVQNNSGASDTFAYRVTSDRSWAVELCGDAACSSVLGTDSNGDGTWDGAPPTSVIAAGATTTVWLRATVPGGATLGSLDTLRLTATSQTVSSVSGSTANLVRVLELLTITPSYTGSTELYAASGMSVYFPHVITHSGSTSQSVTLSMSPSFPLPGGYVARFWTDPNQDGNPTDGVLISGSLVLGAFGGSQHIVTEIVIPASATSGTTVSAATRLALASTPATFREARDDLRVGVLQTYRDSLYTLPSRFFAACSTVYVKLIAPASANVTYLRPNGSTAASRTLTLTGSPAVGRDSYTLLPADPAGNWRVQNTVSEFIDPLVVESTGTLDLTAPSTAQSGQALPVSAIAVSSAVQSAYLATQLRFSLTDPRGNAFLSPLTVSNLDVLPGAAAWPTAGWGSVSYLIYGNYTVTATWLTSCGSTIVTDTTTVSVAPPAPSLGSPAPGAYVNTTAPALSGSSVADPTTTVSVYVDGLFVGSTSGASGTFSLSPTLTAGAHTWYAVQTVNGVAGPASASRGFTIDLVRPTSALTTPAPGSFVNATTYLGVVQGTAADGVSGIQKVDVNLNGTGFQLASGLTAWSIALSPLEGANTVQTRATDVAGNEEVPAAAVSFTYDSVAPAVSISSPTNNSVFRTSNWPGSISGSASDLNSGLQNVEVQVDGGSWLSVSGPLTSWSLTHSPSPGVHTARARATDRAGNVTLSSVVSFTYDIQAPTSSVTSPTDGSFFNASNVPASVSGSASDDRSGISGVEVRVLRNAAVVQDWTAATWTTTWSRAFAPSGDGTYTILSRATDLAGNVETPGAGISFVYDTTRPTSTITSPTAGAFVNSATLTLTGGSSDATAGVDKVQVRVNGGGWSDATGTNPWTYIVPVPTSGNYTVETQAIDRSGNVQLLPTSVSFIYDRLSPTSVVTVPGPSSFYNAAGWTTAGGALQGTASDSPAGIDRVEVSVNGGAFSLATLGTPPTWSLTYTPPTDGTYVVRSRATDLAGNLETVGAGNTFVYDNVEPTSSISAPATGSTFGGGATILFRGSSIDDRAGMLRVETRILLGTTEVQGWTAATGAPDDWTSTYAPTADGTYTFFSRAVDRAGNEESAPQLVTFTVDSSLPVSRVLLPTNGAVYSASTWLSVAGGGASGDAYHGSGVGQVELSLDNAGFNIIASLSNVTGTTADWSHAFTPTEGEHSLQSRMTSVDANLEQPSPAVEFTYDISAPSSLITYPPDGAELNLTSFDITGTADDQISSVAQVTLRLGTSGAFSAVDSGTDSWRDAFSGSDGTYTVQVQAIDAAGNPQGTPTQSTFTIDTVEPTSSIQSPANGQVFSTLDPITLTIDAADDRTGVGLVQVRVGTADWEDATLVAGEWRYEFQPPSDAAFVLQSRAIDDAGNEEIPTTSVTYVFDTVAPSLTITAPNPADGARFNTAPVAITGDAEDDTSGVLKIQLSLDNVAWTDLSLGDTLSDSVSPSGDGVVSRWYRAVDRADHASPGVLVRFTFDQTPPDLTMDAPDAGDRFNSSQLPVTVSGTAQDLLSGLSQVQVNVNAGGWVDLGPTGGWSHDFSPTADGMYAIEVRASDLAGNTTAVVSRSVFYDATSPTSQIIVPADQTYFTSTADILVQGIFNDLTSTVSEVQVRANGGSWTTTSLAAGFSLAFAPPAEGVYQLESRAIDTAGNIEVPTTSIRVTVDATAPTSSVTQPTAGGIYRTDNFPGAIAGTATDNVAGVAGVALLINGGPPEAAAGTDSFSYGLGPTDGVYTVQSQATDLAGNVEVPGAGIQFTYDATPPTASFTSAALAEVGPVPITGTASDNLTGVATVEISIDGGPWVAAVGTSAFSYTFAPSAPGTYQLQVRATDVAGNVQAPATLSLQVVEIDRTYFLRGGGCGCSSGGEGALAWAVVGAALWLARRRRQI